MYEILLGWPHRCVVHTKATAFSLAFSRFCNTGKQDLQKAALYLERPM